MIHKSILHLAYISMVGLILFSIIFAIAANNTVPVTHLTDQSVPVTANDLKPADCSEINLTDIFPCPTDGSVCAATDASELVIGTVGNDDIESGKGDDCILGGGGIDHLKGEKDIDVCLGGPGADTFHPSCETRTD